jgi:hypothetical protein
MFNKPFQEKITFNNYHFMKKNLSNWSRTLLVGVLSCTSAWWPSVVQAAPAHNHYVQVAPQKVSGTVTDENNVGMPGVTIAKKGSTAGTNSDANGKFSIEVNAGDVLVFSFVGYKNQEIKIGAQSILNVQLAPDNKALEEVVVTGYGVQKKVDFLGSATSIKAATIQEMPVTSVESAMQGRMTGVQVQQSSGQPGAGISIRVRGVTSIAGGNEPLFVIDGVPQYNNDNRAMNGMASFNANRKHRGVKRCLGNSHLWFKRCERRCANHYQKW